MNNSEKQIKWAEDIKSELIEELVDLEADIEAYQTLTADDQTPDDYAEVIRFAQLAKARGGYQAAIAAIKNCDDAKWFIDYGRSGVCAALGAAMSGTKMMGGLI